MSADSLSPVLSSSPAESFDKAQYLLDPGPAQHRDFSPCSSASRQHKRSALEVDSLSPPPPACCQCHNEPVLQVPTPQPLPELPLPMPTPQPLPEPPLPMPTLLPRIALRHDMHTTWWACQHTCGSEESCQHERGWKLGSVLGHEQSQVKHPQCSASTCLAHSLLKHRDRPDRRGELGQRYNQERRDQSRAELSNLPLPSLLKTPSTSASVPVLLAPGATATTSASATSAVYPALPSQECHTILYITEPAFEQTSYMAARGDSAYHYSLFDRELFKDKNLVNPLHKMLFKGSGVNTDTNHHPNEREIACCVYNYVSHM
jgi:hypothetical protein